jgi:hypothetical protein
VARKGNNSPLGKDTDVFDEENKVYHDGVYAALETSCIELELTASRASVKKIRDELAKQTCINSNIMQLELELSSRLVDEMAEMSFFSLSMSEIQYFENPLRKWEKIVERFPDFCD